MLPSGQKRAQSRWAGKKPWPAYRPGWGLAELRFPPHRCGDRGSHPPYRVAPLSRQPKEHGGKRPMTAKTQPSLQGRAAQHKDSCSTDKVPWPWPGMPFAQRASLAPSSDPAGCSSGSLLPPPLRSSAPSRCSPLLALASAAPVAPAHGPGRAQAPTAPAPAPPGEEAPPNGPTGRSLKPPPTDRAPTPPNPPNFSSAHHSDVRRSPVRCWEPGPLGK